MISYNHGAAIARYCSIMILCYCAQRLGAVEGRGTGDPGMVEILDTVESGEPQEVPVEGEESPKGMRIAIARAAGRRGLAVEMFEANDAQPSGNGRRRGRPQRQD